MKGLIIKDFISIKKSIKVSVFLIIFYIVYSVITGLDMITMLPVVTIILVSSTFSYDEYNHWDKIAMSMPISVKQIITSKFLFTLIISAIISVFSVIVVLLLAFAKGNFQNINENMMTVLLANLATCILIFLIMPLIIKFGHEKGKLAFMILIVALGLLMYILNSFEIIKLEVVSENMVLYALAILFVIIGVVSYLCSLKIYSDKEF